MRKNTMKNVMQWAMAWLMLFAAPSMASAQFGSLKKMINKATKSTTSGSSNSSSATDDADPYGASQIDRIKANKQKAEADRQKAEAARQQAGCKIIESRRDKLVGSWNSRTYTITSAEQSADGKFITYTWNPSTGEIKRNDGEVVATIQGDKFGPSPKYIS